MNAEEKYKKYKTFQFKEDHEIILTCQKSSIRKFQDTLLIPHPNTKYRKGWQILGVHNKYNVVYKNKAVYTEKEKIYYENKGYKAKEFIYPTIKFQNIINGQIITEGNSIKIKTKDKKCINEIIMYLIKLKIINAKNHKKHNIYYYRRKFLNNHRELDNYNLVDRKEYKQIKEYMNEIIFSNYETIKEYLKEIGNRKINIKEFINLNMYNESVYIWTNNSSKLIIYNYTAKENKRDFYIEGDKYKIELILRKQYLYNRKIKRRINIIKTINNSEIINKVHNLVSVCFMHEYYTERMLNKLNKVA